VLFLIEQFNKVKDALASDGIVFAPPDKWMMMSDCSLIIG